MNRTHLLQLLILPGLFMILSCENDHPDQLHKIVIDTDNAPAAVGPYSQAVRAGNTLYLAGQIGIDPQTGNLSGDDLESQTIQVLNNIEAILEAAGYSLSDVVSVQVYLDDLQNYSQFNDIYSTYFTDVQPARAVVEVSRIPLDAKIEIMAVAVR